MKPKILLYIVICFILHVTGCIDNPVVPSGNINGIVYDRYGMPNPYTFVSAGDFPIIATDRFGKFTIENTSIPFNLTIANDYDGYATKYMNLSTDPLSVYSIDDYGWGYDCRLKITIPHLLSEYDEAFIRFISSDLYVQHDYIVYPYYNTTYTLRVDIPPGKQSISGKVIYLGYRKYSNISSYENFGMKDVTLYPGSNGQQMVFTPGDIAYNPEEINMNYHVTIPNSYSYYFNEAFFNFPGYHPNASFKIQGSYTESNNYTIILPLLPQLDYNIKFYSHVLFYHNSSFTKYSSKWIYVNPGENINLTNSKSLTLQYPPENYPDVNDTTKFIFTDNEPGGIYIYQISFGSLFWGYGFLNVVTDKYPLQFSDFKARGFNFEREQKYYWSVYKYPGYSDINEFASRKIMEDTVYTSIPASESFSFTIR